MPNRGYYQCVLIYSNKINNLDKLCVSTQNVGATILIKQFHATLVSIKYTKNLVLSLYINNLYHFSVK